MVIITKTETGLEIDRRPAVASVPEASETTWPWPVDDDVNLTWADAARQHDSHGLTRDPSDPVQGRSPARHSETASRPPRKASELTGTLRFQWILRALCTVSSRHPSFEAPPPMIRRCGRRPAGLPPPLGVLSVLFSLQE